MKETLEKLLQITEGCRDDMHEPDEQGLSAKVLGVKLDNAFPSTTLSHEIRVMLTRGSGNDFDTEFFNLATLIALARKADLGESNDDSGLMEALEYVKLNLSPLIDGATSLKKETCLSQDLCSGGTDILKKIDEAIRQAKEEN